MKEYKKQLVNQGYCVVENVIPLSVVAELRQKYLSQFTTDKLTFTAQEVLANKDLSDILFSEKVIGIIGELVGNNYCMYPDFAFRRGLYISWHSDVPYLTPDKTALGANVFEVSLYLQDNTLEYGGGLDAIVGSHNCTELDHTNLDLSLLEYDKAQIMPSTAGSLTIWDSRLIHRSSQPHIESANNEIKLALQWTVSVDGTFAANYLQFLQDRIDTKLKSSIYDQDTREIRNVKAMAELSYPTSFSTEQVAVIEKNNIQFKLLK